MEKRILPTIKASFFIAFLAIFSLSCKTGEGCVTTDGYSQEVDLTSTKRGKSSLFSKKTNKKIRKKRGG